MSSGASFWEALPLVCDERHYLGPEPERRSYGLRCPCSSSGDSFRGGEGSPHWWPTLKKKTRSRRSREDPLLKEAPGVDSLYRSLIILGLSVKIPFRV